MNRGKLVFNTLGLRYGFNLSEMIRFVEENQYWSDDHIKFYQLERMKDIIWHVYKYVPFYRHHMKKIGMEPSDFKGLGDLLHFPVIDKNVIMADYSSFLSENYTKFKPMVRYTGGTTGVPFRYFNDSRSWGLGWATKIRTFAWGNYSFGVDKVAVLKGGTMHGKGTFGLRTKLWRYLQLNYNIPIMHLTEFDLKHHVKQIIRQRIRFVRGYPSAVFTLAEYVRRERLHVRLECIFTTAEMLLEHQRKVIEETFSCQIIDTYGCGEGMAGANQCEYHEGYHLNVETCYLEVLDDKTGKPIVDAEGGIVLTSLQDYAMPFIRYAPGDRAVRGTNVCECGRRLPLLKKIIGRTSDQITLSNGIIINGLSIPFEDLYSIISKFQLVQETSSSLTLNVVPKDSYDEQEERKLIDTLKHLVGEGISLRVNKVNTIDQTSAGKFRYIVSRINDKR